MAIFVRNSIQQNPHKSTVMSANVSLHEETRMSKFGVQSPGLSPPSHLTPSAQFLFFLSLFVKTQPNHWTKRMTSTRLGTYDPRTCPGSNLAENRTEYVLLTTNNIGWRGSWIRWIYIYTYIHLHIRPRSFLETLCPSFFLICTIISNKTCILFQ